jgi:hypothetical protein
MDARRPRRCPRPSMTTTCRSRRRGDDGERTFAMARKKSRRAGAARARPRRSRGRDVDARARDDIASRASVDDRLGERPAASPRPSARRERVHPSGFTVESPGRVWRKRAGTRPIRARARRARATASEGRRAEDKADTHLIHDVQLIRYACQRDRGKRARRPRRWRFSAEAELADGAMASGETEPPLLRAGYRVYFSLQVS